MLSKLYEVGQQFWKTFFLFFKLSKPPNKVGVVFGQSGEHGNGWPKVAIDKGGESTNGKDRRECKSRTIIFCQALGMFNPMVGPLGQRSFLETLVSSHKVNFKLIPISQNWLVRWYLY